AEIGLRQDQAHHHPDQTEGNRAQDDQGSPERIEQPDSTRVWDLVTHLRDTIPDVVTLPQHFKQHGYHAVAYGKIYHNTLPDRQSWNEPNHWPQKATTWSQASRQQLAAYRAKMRALGKSDAAIARMRAPATDDEDIPDSQRPDGEIADQAITAMRRLAQSEQPFFLAVGFIRPHLPFTPPKKYWDLYRRDELALAGNRLLPSDSPPMAMNTMYELRDYMDFADSPPPREGSLLEQQQRRLKHGYYASVSYVDAQIARLLGTLDELGLATDTIVVLWGDHGWKLGEHNSWCKQTNYEIDTRVPLIIRSPRAKANGRRCPALVEFVDIYPTLCELAGLPLPDHLEGRSVVPLLAKPDQPWKEAAFSQFRRRHEGVETMGYAMRTDRYRYVEWINRQSVETVATELYDHEHDPQENTNLAAAPEHRRLVGQLSDQLWSSLPKPKPFRGKRPAKRPRLTFQNRLDEPVTVWWIRAEGDRKLVGKIAPGGQLGQQTTLGHHFVVEGEATDFRRAVVVVSSERAVVLDRWDAELQESDDGRSVNGREPEAKRVPREAKSAFLPARLRVQPPPPELEANPFYVKYVDADGYPILASARVNDYALKEAAFLVSQMLAHRPDVKDAMVRSGSRMLILAHDEVTTDLPEFVHMRPKDYWDARARGTGGSQADPYCSCAEENLSGGSLGGGVRSHSRVRTQHPPARVGESRSDVRPPAESRLRRGDSQGVVEGEIRVGQSPRVLRRSRAVLVQQQPSSRPRPQPRIHARGADRLRSPTGGNLPRGIRRHEAGLHEAGHTARRSSRRLRSGDRADLPLARAIGEDKGSNCTESPNALPGGKATASHAADEAKPDDGPLTPWRDEIPKSADQPTRRIRRDKRCPGVALAF
ncbi:MAG: sulfatase-like hydrolase/transferase, partial [Planctomycetota bacterium]